MIKETDAKNRCILHNLGSLKKSFLLSLRSKEGAVAI